jgi:hypothetical protein
MPNADPEEIRRKVWDAIRAEVCEVCLDRHDDGTCGLKRRPCAIAEHLPRAIEVAMAIDSPTMDAYYEAFEREICSRCSYENLDGHCRPRTRGECALYAYLPLVVDAIRTAGKA